VSAPVPPEARVQAIRERLKAALEPTLLDIVDESHKHAGHAGARGGAGHFQVTRISNKFKGLSSIARHRLVYAAVSDLMPGSIHALSIKALAPGEQT
jgi:BolA protein